MLEVRLAGALYLVEMHEWEPRHACPVCQQEQADDRCAHCGRELANARSRFCSKSCRTAEFENRRYGGVCPRCGGEGYVGQHRPREPVIAFDLAWSDDGHCRLIGPRTKRMSGECLFVLHHCV